ncbi:cytochrome P450 [Cristinia sonorae]|uniref:Cytochrome P450 n=1 Tax=Cristinia sonorae TaxID=1940300 RepID=A0A8K0US98_9AGAR|nr:cytochrome P450 [Cristinia sonorae]
MFYSGNTFCPSGATDIAALESLWRFIKLKIITCATSHSNMGTITIAFVLLVLAIVIARFSKRSRYPLPPGPKPWPIIGNALDMPLDRPWETYAKWCKQYDSDLVFVEIPMQPNIIVGSFKVCVELFDKRSQIYSDRIPPAVVDMMGGDSMFSIMRYGSSWRAHRRMFHQHFHAAVVQNYRPIQLQQTRALLSWLLDAPENTRKRIRQFVTSIVFSITYGKQIAGMEDEYVTLAEVSIEGMSRACVPGAYFVNLLPVLKHIPSWVPGTAARKLVDHYRPYVFEARNKPYDELKDAFIKGVAPPSVATSLIEEVRAKYGETEEEGPNDIIAKNVAAIAYGAGADTTSSSSLSFLLAMAMFPEVQKKAQAELDRVLGPERLPTFEDVDEIPYIQAVVMETLRWMPVTPFGIPHAVMEDDQYEGYHIPKGTQLIPNVWAMLRNPVDYPNPDQFMPERFIGKDGNINPDVLNPASIAFGFGRRACPGKHLAMSTLKIYAASVLYAFDISAGVDADGNAVALTNEQVGALISMPNTVPCGLKPRSEAIERLIRVGVQDSETK